MAGYDKKKIINPEHHGWGVDYPSVKSEFEVQAYLWMHLRRLGYDARAEVETPYGRLDLVIFSGKHPAQVIEIKRFPPQGKQQRISFSNQLNFYREGSGCRTIVVCGMKEAKRFLSVVKRVGLLNSDVRVCRMKGKFFKKKTTDTDSFSAKMLLSLCRDIDENGRVIPLPCEALCPANS